MCWFAWLLEQAEQADSQERLLLEKALQLLLERFQERGRRCPMILRSVELESFGRFRGQTVEFRRGMNLVIGPNEAGKSTLAEAVPAVLFGTDRLERYKPWGRNTCAAALFFEGRGRTIQVKRNLVTDDVELVEKDDLYHVLSQFSGKVPLRGRSATCREYRDLLEIFAGRFR